MNVGMIAFSAQGLAVGERLKSFFNGRGDGCELTRCPEGGLQGWTQSHFSWDALIFIGACGIAVRAVAPYLRSKTQDTAVIVLDELAAYVIPLLAGHIGGANRLAIEVATYLDAQPVLTTATDIQHLFAVDSWAVRQGLAIANPQRIKRVSAGLLAGEQITVYSDFPLDGRLPAGLTLGDDAYDMIITYRRNGEAAALRLVPPIITLGLGCKKHTGADAIEQVFQLLLTQTDCHPLAVKQVCSIDLKAEEPGVLEFCQQHALPYRTFSARDLLAVSGSFGGSAFVQSVTGVDNVCERSAVLGAGREAKLLAGKRAEKDRKSVV